MQFGIVRLAGYRGEGDQSNAPGDIPARVLEQAELFDEVRLAGANRCLIKGVNVVQNPDENLQPVTLGPAQFVHLQAQMIFLRVVGFLEKLAEGPRFGSDAFGNFAGGVDGVDRMFVSGLPIGSGVGDLAADDFEVLNLQNRVREPVGFGQFHRGAVFEQERQHAKHTTEAQAEDAPKILPGVHRPFAMRISSPQDQISERHEQYVTEKKWPFWKFGHSPFTHSNARCNGFRRHWRWKSALQKSDLSG